MSYADVAALKAYLRIPAEDALDDGELQGSLDAATSTINHLCSRTFDVAPVAPAPAEARWFQPWYDRGRGRWVLPIDDLMTSTDLVISTWDTTDADWSVTVPTAEVYLRPINAPEEGKPWTSLVMPAGASFGSGFNRWVGDDDADFVKVTARWGWTTVPAGVVQATLLVASRFFRRRDSTFGIISSPDGSENSRLLGTVDPDVQRMLKGYVKYWAAR